YMGTSGGPGRFAGFGPRVANFTSGPRAHRSGHSASQSPVVERGGVGPCSKRVANRIAPRIGARTAARQFEKTAAAFCGFSRDAETGESLAGGNGDGSG